MATPAAKMRTAAPIMIHFDTNFLIQATIAGSSAHAQLRLRSAGGEVFGISSVAWAEYLCGPLDATGGALARRIFPNPEPFLSADATAAADLFDKTGRRSRSLADCMIAAVVMRCNAKLATRNAGEFVPFQILGLALA